jgi:hypothetical protein
MIIIVKRFTGILLTVAGILVFPYCEPATGPDPEKGLTFTLADPVSQSVAAGAPGAFRIAVKNHGPSAVTITCIKKANSLPDSQWSAFFCAGGNCFGPMVDSVDAGPIAVGATDTSTLDIQTGNIGSGQAYFKIYSKEDPTQSYENTFTCTVAQAASNERE